jgi:hypothetical protein
MKDRAVRRTRIGVLAVTALAVSLIAIGGPQAANAADYASISGTVTADAGGAPLTFPYIELYKKSGASWNFYDSTSGGRDGTYHFQNISTGTYTLVYAAQHGDNFVSEWWSDKPDQKSATPVTVSNTIGSVTHLVADVGLATGATISGHLTVPSASFAPDPYIDLLKPDTSQGYSGWTYAGLWDNPAEDGSGNYKIVGIRPGSYSLFFGDSAASSDFAPRYFKSGTTGTPNDWQASSITLAAGQEVTGIDAALVHGATGTGKVTDYLGRAISGVSATFWRQTTLMVGGQPQWESWSGTTTSAGAFAVRGMPQGSNYILEFTKTGYTTVDYPANGAFFTLSGGMTKTIPTVKLYRKLASSTPTISGTKRVGYRLTANHGTWTAGTSFSYAWYANGVYISGSSGPTHSTFVLTGAQRGKTITVRVTGKKAGYTTLTRVSAATVKIG